MELHSKDGRITIFITDNPTKNALLPQTDFSLVELPIEKEDVVPLFKELFRTQKTNHISLVSSRLPKKTRLKTFANMALIEETGFKYHDHITILSQAEYKNIPSNLTQIGETFVLFTKGDELNKEATAWFREDLGNCGNVWDVTPQEGEKITSKTVSRHFSWEQGVLMSQLASPLISRKFLVIGKVEPAMVEFALRFNLCLHAISTDEVSARRVLKVYHKLIEKVNNN